MSEVPGYQRFLAELKRRRVFRVAAVYGATAFVVVQVADVLQEALHLPEAFLTGVAVLALLGFPIAIVLAWAYERTPQGVVRTGTATTQEIAEIVAQPATRRWPSGVLALVGIVALAAAAWLTLVRQPSGGSDASGTLADASIAVLPFSNLSGDDETQPFVDGIHDDLLTQLSKIGSITVISRTSVQEYRNTTKNVRDIAAELGVSTVLEGGVQRAGDQYRINVQLIDAETDAHLWAEQYSGELTTASIFDVQTQIAASIAAALEANLTAGERANLERLPTRDLEAYELYQGALAQALSGRQEVEFRTAGRLIDRAIERDSTFAEAYAVKAIIASYMYWFFYDRSDSLVAAADEFSRRALELAPGLSDGHWARGHYYYRTQLDYDRALEEVRLALTGRPGDGEFEGLAGDILRRKGDVEGALARYQRAVKLNPRDASQRLTLGETHMLLRDYPAAEAAFLRALELRPDFGNTYRRLAQLAVQANGDTVAMQKWLEESDDLGVYRPREYGWFELEMLRRNHEAAVEATALWPDGVSETQFRHWPRALGIGFALRMGGDSVGARAAFDEARVHLEELVESDPTEPRYRSALGLALAGLGNDEEAIREGEEGLRIMPPEREAWRGSRRAIDLAQIYAMTGRVEEAIERIEFVLSIPSELSPWILRLDPAWDPLRGNLRFEALVVGE
jgi:TolB-like protein/Flp pilus assembly protein TadD